MNNPEVLDPVPVTELLPVSTPVPLKKKLFLRYYKSGLLLVGIYAMIINQVQRNKKYVSLHGSVKAGSRVPKTEESSLATGLERNFQQAFFLVK